VHNRGIFSIIRYEKQTPNGERKQAKRALTNLRMKERYDEKMLVRREE
jgi:hypothetical protein